MEKFDQYAQEYLSLHRDNLALSGEGPTYFAQYKARCVQRLAGTALDLPILDYGCGVGLMSRVLAERFPRLHCFDPSRASLAIARDHVPSATFHSTPAAIPDRHFGLVVMSGVLHHVPPEQRGTVIKTAVSKLRPPGGRLVLFEHNPLNPLTRYVVSRCAFDDDAILLGPWEAGRVLRANGLPMIQRRFIMFFPRALSALRVVEPYLGWLPLGAQTMVVGGFLP